MQQTTMLGRGPIDLIRAACAGLMIAHGSYRVLHTGNVAGFGGFLIEAGVPMGNVIAWGITLFEVIGGLSFLAGVAIRPVATLFIIELTAGILLVHAREGWFVVGGGRNGMEYSVLLVTCMAAVAWGRGVPDGAN